MKNSFTAKLAKGLPAMVAAAVLAHSPVASAGPAIGVDPSGSGTDFTYADLWTNLTDSGLAVGFIPGASVPGGTAPYTFDFLAQARVGTLSLGPTVVFTDQLINNTNPAACSALGCYEITKVLNIKELVTLQNPGVNAIFGFTPQTADVDSSTAGLQQLAIYLDNTITDGSIAVPGDGTGTVSGYTDGTLILSGHLVFNSSSFTLSSGVGTGSFDLRFVIDYVDPLYLDAATGGIIGDKITGTTNVPTFFTPAKMWDGTATSGGLLLKVDSSETFIARIPEPGTLALMGLGLVGLGASLRRRPTQA